jgi:hypothetical protein
MPNSDTECDSNPDPESGANTDSASRDTNTYSDSSNTDTYPNSSGSDTYSDTNTYSKSDSGGTGRQPVDEDERTNRR